MVESEHVYAWDETWNLIDKKHDMCVATVHCNTDMIEEITKALNNQDPKIKENQPWSKVWKFVEQETKNNVLEIVDSTIMKQREKRAVAMLEELKEKINELGK